MNTQTSNLPLEQRNQAVLSAFLAIMQGTKELTAGLPQEMLRHSIEVKDNEYAQSKVLEFMTPLCYLCLRDSEQGYYIHFGFDQSIEFANLTGVFIRMIYKATMKEQTKVPIEDCVAAHSIVTDTSGLFDHTQWRHPSWPVIVIDYKQTGKPKKRKRTTV